MGYRNVEFLVGKCQKINQKLHGGDRSPQKKKKKKNQNEQMNHFSPLSSFQLHIYQKRLCDLFHVFLECIMSQLVCETEPGSTS